jgi:sugar-phosphatase
VHGQRSADTVGQLIEPEHRAVALAQIDRYEVEDAGNVSAIRGAYELTAAIPDRQWAVVTSGTRALAEARLRAAGMPRPAVLVTADDVRFGKPDPEGYLSAARRLGVATGRTVVLEDALTGIRAARAAGVSAVIGVGTRGLDSAADAVVNDLSSVTWVEGQLLVRR